MFSLNFLKLSYNTVTTELWAEYSFVKLSLLNLKPKKIIEIM